MVKKIKWEKPRLRDLNEKITIGACTPYGEGFYDSSDCPSTGQEASSCSTNGQWANSCSANGQNAGSCATGGIPD